MKRSITKKILEIISEEAEDFFNIFDRPYSLFHYLLKEYKKLPKSEYNQAIKRMHSRKYINFIEKNGKTQIIITKGGKKRLFQYKLEEIKIKTPKKWDKKWRILIFDIPEKKKKARDVLRKKIDELGLYRLQDSVWVHPYKMKECIKIFCELYNVSPYVKLIEANSISEDQSIRKHFNLK